MTQVPDLPPCSWVIYGTKLYQTSHFLGDEAPIFGEPNFCWCFLFLSTETLAAFFSSVFLPRFKLESNGFQSLSWRIPNHKRHICSIVIYKGVRPKHCSSASSTPAIRLDSQGVPAATVDFFAQLRTLGPLQRRSSQAARRGPHTSSAISFDDQWCHDMVRARIQILAQRKVMHTWSGSFLVPCGLQRLQRWQQCCCFCLHGDLFGCQPFTCWIRLEIATDRTLAESTGQWNIWNQWHSCFILTSYAALAAKSTQKMPLSNWSCDCFGTSRSCNLQHHSAPNKTGRWPHRTCLQISALEAKFIEATS